MSAWQIWVPIVAALCPMAWCLGKVVALLQQIHKQLLGIRYDPQRPPGRTEFDRREHL